MNKALAVLMLLSCAACSLPAAAPSQTQHDLGSVFSTGETQSPVPLRAIQVSAQPLTLTMSMQYREASQPTRRGSYALNRWAAPPATMIESALGRLLSVDGAGRCRLQYTLTEFIIDVDANGKSKAVLVADAALYREPPATVVQRSFDISVPMNEPGPAAGALALREAVHKLGESTAIWLGGESARSCRL